MFDSKEYNFKKVCILFKSNLCGILLSIIRIETSGKHPHKYCPLSLTMSEHLAKYCLFFNQTFEYLTLGMSNGAEINRGSCSLLKK